MTPRLRRRRALALLAVLTFGSGTGCSALFVDGPPPDHARRVYFDCTSSRVAPGFDVALASILALGALGALMDPGANNPELITAVAMTGGLTASAAYGFRLTDQCRQAKGELAGRLNRSLAPEWYPGAPAGGAWQPGGPPPAMPPPQWPPPAAVPPSAPPTPPEGAPR